MYFIIGLSAAPLGLIISFSFICGIVLTSLFLPILIGPLCFSVYVTFLAYIVWRIVRALLHLGQSLEASMKQSFRSCMGWLYRNTQRVPFSGSSGSPMPEPLDAEDDNRSENGEIVEQVLFEESLSDDEHEQTAQGDFRQLNVRSVSRKQSWSKPSPVLNYNIVTILPCNNLASYVKIFFVTVFWECNEH